MKYTQIIEWLRMNEFKVEHSEKFYPDYFFCKKDQTNVIVKEYKGEVLSSQIRSDAVDVRSVLNKIGENIWNTYFIICNNDSERDIPYTFEKDSVGLRKYVINSIEDISRIPFLDLVDSKNSDKYGVIKLPDIDRNQNLEKLVDQIIITDGLQKELDSREVRSILIDLYGSEVISFED